MQGLLRIGWKMERFDIVFVVCCLLFASLHETSSLTATSVIATTDEYQLAETFEEFEKIPCNITRAHEGRDLNLYCPSIDLQNFTVEIKFREFLRVVCLAEDVNLTSISIDIGPIEGFASKRCNLVNRLRQVIQLWQIEDTKRWDIEGYSDEDFALRRSEFENVNVSQVEHVRIEKSNIVEIDFDTFYDFVSLITASFKWNKIKVLPDLFVYSKSLKSMEFAMNQLERLPDQLTAPSLKTLQLWKNNLTFVNESLFSNAPSLLTVEFSNNKIEFLPEKLLHPVPNLMAIGMLQNYFAEIPVDFFKMNKNLREVRLSSRNLTTLPENLFEGLANLTNLSLQMNAFETLPETLFAGLRKLEKLYLNENRLQQLSRTVFGDLESLLYLDLSNNELSDWSSDITLNLNNLRVLMLSGNNLRTIGPNYFYTLGNLERLSLDNNGITHIDIAAFNSLKLEELNLSRNNLTDSDSSVSFVDGIMSVGTLSLDRNLFKSLPLGLHRFTYVDISHNNIKQVDMIDIQNLKAIYLNDNQIEVLNFFGLDVLFLEDDLKLGPKTSIYVDNNPILCDCSSYSLIEFFDRTYRYKRIYDKFSITGQLKCHGPAKLAGTDLRKLKSKDFDCSAAQFFSCPENCSCAVYPKYQSLNVSCAGLNLNASPPLSPFAPVTFHRMFTVKNLVVDLSNNSISKFSENDASYSNVTELYLSDNKLDSVSWLPPKLEVLELNGNRLQNLDYRAISILNKTVTLKRWTLHDNNWNCNCKLVNLTKLIKLRHPQIQYDSRFLCSNGERVTTMTEGVLCVLENQAALIAIGVCFFLFLIAIGVALVLYYKYEYHVKVWLYSKPLLMRFVAEEDLDKDKIYDAFLSYSHEDEEFVLKELVSELEGGADDSYKLCIAIRDWIVGEFITKQIADSVANSRRTIIVLSPHFLQSEWATMEFRTAHTKAMKEGRHRLIVILYGDIDPNAVEDEDLRAYLSTNTYVKWGDPWFWKKLRYVMPHRRNEHANNNNQEVKVKRSKNARKMENIMVTIDKMDLINSPATPNLGTPPAVSLDPLLVKSSALEFKSAPITNETPPVEGKLIISANR